MSSYSPKNLREASDFLHNNPRSALVGGGSRPISKKPEILVELGALGLDYIDVFSSSLEEGAIELRLGATASLEQMAQSPLLADFCQGILVQGARKTLEMGLAPQGATVGGEIGMANPHSPFLAVLLALGAVVRVFLKDQVAFHPMDTLYSPLGTSALEPGEIVEEILILPEFSQGKSALEIWVEKDQPFGLALFLQMDGQMMKTVQLAGIGLENHPARLDSLEAMVRGHKGHRSSLDFPLKLLKRELSNFPLRNQSRACHRLQEVFFRVFTRCWS